MIPESKREEVKALNDVYWGRITIQEFNERFPGPPDIFSEPWEKFLQSRKAILDQFSYTEEEKTRMMAEIREVGGLFSIIISDVKRNGYSNQDEFQGLLQVLEWLFNAGIRIGRRTH